MPPNKRLQILIVDDEPSVREMLSEVVRFAGCDVAGTGQDGIAAVELAAKLRPDILILDLHMPRMNGLDALPAILAAQTTRRILLISGGYNLHNLPINLTQHSGVEFMSKPFDVGAIVDLLDRWSAELS